jgi:hydroxymethylglutaryl-CoA lyase
VKFPTSIRITEVGPRDGLQNEAATIRVDDKVKFINLLSRCGVAEIEVTSFVSPKWVPQLADADDVLRRVERVAGVVYSALVPNEKGLERALSANVNKIAVFTAASETFSRKNSNASISETLERFAPVIRAAKAHSLPVRAYVSCAVACPYEGPISSQQVRSVVERLQQLGADEIDLGDTIGVAVPSDIDRLYEGIAPALNPQDSTLHLHDTRGTALACAYRAMQLGVQCFDSSCVGLGGCPYAPGAAGNLATEDLVYLCKHMAIDSGVDLDALLKAGEHIAPLVTRAPTGRVFQAAHRRAASG